MVFVLQLHFFFFKQKTAYEMRISDWSSDVCSSDLAADVAAYIDPRDIAAYVPAPPPTTELVAVSDGFFRLLENITMVALFVVGFFLLARLLHAWMLHRSIRRAIEAKSDMVGAMIDKLNKPYEHLGWPGGDRRGADGPGGIG